tara:strand:+ start:355 stop:813 length:459 start_codon:yes stop_codon:yes gene_type:complete
MKKLFFILLIVSLTACTNDDDTIPSTTNNTASVQSQIQSSAQTGTWRVSLYSEDGKNETTNFVGYTFTFNTNISISASNQKNNYTGTWSITDNNSSDDSVNDVDFNILFILTNNFQDFNVDCNVLSHAQSKIELRDISGGNGGIDLLTFEKN